MKRELTITKLIELEGEKVSPSAQPSSLLESMIEQAERPNHDLEHEEAFAIDLAATCQCGLFRGPCMVSRRAVQLTMNRA